MTQPIRPAIGERFSPGSFSDADTSQLLALLSEDWPILFNAPIAASVVHTHTNQAAAAVTPITGSAAASVARAPVLRRWRRRVVAAAASLTFVGQMLVGTAALAAVGAGAAAAGVLPDPVQQFVADVGQHVGLELPQPATPAVPGGPGTPAIPAAPITPAGVALLRRANPELRPITPATPATRAEPGTPGGPATPATPATPADPPLENSPPGLQNEPVEPPGLTNKPDTSFGPPSTS